MDILPIDKIREEDAPLVGRDIVNLATLTRFGFPVAPGIVVCPPEIELNTVLKHFNFKDKEIFEQSLTLVKQQILKIPAPVELSKVLSRRKVDVNGLWRQLLEIWLGEVRARIWQQGFQEGVTLGLSAQPVFFIQKINLSGHAYFDPRQGQVTIRMEKGSFTPSLQMQVAEMVEKGDKRLFLSQVYYFIVQEKSTKVELVKVGPFTPAPDTTSQQYTASKEIKDKPSPKSVMKVYLDLSQGLVVNPDVDGVLICGERSGDFESQVFKIIESAHTFPDHPVIFKLSDQVDQIGGVRGSLRLIHQNVLLRSEVEALLFARNHKKLLNVQLAIPFVRSSNEFLEMKRTLATLGVSRKGTLKLWLELAVPENILNLEEYLIAGVDGVLVNLDELSSWLGGFDAKIPESVFYQKQVKALLKLLEDAFRLLHRYSIPILAMGKLSLHDEVLEFLVAKGAKGVVADLANSHSLHEHLRFVEKRHVRNKLA